MSGSLIEEKLEVLEEMVFSADEVADSPKQSFDGTSRTNGGRIPGAPHSYASKRRRWEERVL
jgi:hypothetical protein